MAEFIHGQRWAAAREPTWRVHLNEYTGAVEFVRAVAYCHTKQMDYATATRPYNKCLVFGGKASWLRCAVCRENHGIGFLRRADVGRMTIRYAKAEIVD